LAFKNILLTGSKGILGSALTDKLGDRAGVTLTGVDIEELDVTDRVAVGSVVAEVRPDLILNCAAYTDVDGCEDEFDLALLVNGEAVGILAAAAKETGAKIVHVSTDFIFDGEAGEPYAEDAPPAPLSAYGKSKLAGERELLASGADFLMLRTSWLFGAGGGNFVETILGLADRNTEIGVVDNEVAAPTYAPDLADGMLALLEKGATGVVHCTNAGAASRYEWAEAILSLAGKNTALKKIDRFERKARVPKYSVLSTGRFVGLVGKALPPWRDAVARYIAERKG